LCVSAAAVLTATHTPSLHDALPIYDECGTVDDAGRITTVVDVVDLLDPVVLLQGDGVEPAHVADHRERRLEPTEGIGCRAGPHVDRKSTRLNSSHVSISYAVFCLKK